MCHQAISQSLVHHQLIQMHLKKVYSHHQRHQEDVVFIQVLDHVLDLIADHIIADHAQKVDRTDLVQRLVILLNLDLALEVIQMPLECLRNPKADLDHIVPISQMA